MNEFNWKEYDWSQAVGPGWKHLVDPLQEYAKAHDLRIKQVKEKFGGLRFYSEWDDQFVKLINEAEDVSVFTCDVCGKPGKIRGGGWLMTRCDEHSGGR
jgi:hypothetical protein